MGCEVGSHLPLGLSFAPNFVFVTAYLRGKSYTLQFPILRCAVQWFSVSTELCGHNHSQLQSIFFLPQKMTVPVSSGSPFPAHLPTP